MVSQHPAVDPAKKEEEEVNSISIVEEAARAIKHGVAVIDAFNLLLEILVEYVLILRKVGQFGLRIVLKFE